MNSLAIVSMRSSSWSSMREKCVKSKRRALGVDERARLLDVIAQHAVQGRVEQVCGRVVGLGGPAGVLLDLEVDRVVYAQRSLLSFPMWVMRFSSGRWVSQTSKRKPSPSMTPVSPTWPPVSP